MEKTTLNMKEVIEFMKHIAPDTGDSFSTSMVQRRFRTGYINARKAIDELVELGYLDLTMIDQIPFHRRK